MSPVHLQRVWEIITFVQYSDVITKSKAVKINALMRVD